MITIVMPDGPLRAAVQAAIAARGEPVRLFDENLEDLFAAALESRAIVHGPCPGEGSGPDQRLDDVLGAMTAPGMRRLVLVLPGPAPAVVARVKRSGAPYLVLVIPPLLEALAKRLEPGGGRWWLPGDERRTVITAEGVTTAVLHALDRGEDGVVEYLPGETLSLDRLVRRALEQRRLPGRVHALPRPVFRAGLRLGLLRDARPRLGE